MKSTLLQTISIFSKARTTFLKTRTTFPKTITTLIVSLSVMSCAGGSSSPSPQDTATDAPTPSSTPSSIMPSPSPSPASPSPEPVSTPAPVSTPSPVSTPAPTSTPPLTALDCGGISGGISNNALDDRAKEYLLCKHNESRSEVALGLFVGRNALLPFAQNMQKLQWDSKLEEVAQLWANQCVWQHNSDRQSEYNALSPTSSQGEQLSNSESVGENIAYNASSSLKSANIEQALNGYNNWVDEGNDWAFGRISDAQTCRGVCGHFTQIIWANTYKVGCAVNFCEAGTLSSLPATYLVCNYASAGNFTSQSPYQETDSIAEVCTSPEDNQNNCENGLTSLTN